MRPTFLIRDRNFVSETDTIIEMDSFNWDNDFDCNRSGLVTVFTDKCLDTVDNCNSNVKVAWIMESPEVDHLTYQYIANNYTKFTAVLTFWTYLLPFDPRFVYYEYGNAWINGKDRNIHKKDKLLSIIASSKYFTTGHRLRHDIVSNFNSFPGFDLYGGAYKPLEKKIDGLRDYRYSFAIENCRYNTYFTEKLLDCFLTGTVPIYWGAPEITKKFDASGMVNFTTIEEVPDILKKLSHEDYMSRLPAIVENFYTAQKYARCNTNLWHAYFKQLSEILGII